MEFDYEIQWDRETFGLAVFYTKGTGDGKHPDFLRKNSVTIVIGFLVIGITW